MYGIAKAAADGPEYVCTVTFYTVSINISNEEIILSRRKFILCGSEIY